MFSEYLDRGAAINPTGAWAIQGDASITHAQARVLSQRIALGLQAEGLGRGAKVAVYSPNDTTAMAAIIALDRIGSTFVPLNTRSGLDELTQLLVGAECEFLIYHDGLAHDAGTLLRRVPAITGAVSFGGGATDDFARWLERADGELPDPVGAQSVVILGGSGGTTGAPKIIPVTGRQMLLMSCAFHAHMHEDKPPVYLMAPPLTHAAGFSAYPVLAEGGTLVIQDGVDPGAMFDAIERHRVTRLFLPPTAIYTLLNDPGVDAVDFRSLEHFIYAAAPMSADKLVQAVDTFGPVMAQTYGQVEVPMMATVLTPAEHVDALEVQAHRDRLKSCGRQSIVATVQVMDDDDQVAATGERGEIVIRGDLVMDGYYRNPEATAATTRAGGWHATGDIGYRDADGYLYIVDRKKDMIISGGFNVHPTDVERVIWSLEQVTDCAVIGLPDEKWGEAVTAVVELKEGASLSEDELIRTCKEQLGSVKAPKAVLFRELPRSATGKVLKRALREEFWAGQERNV